MNTTIPVPFVFGAIVVLLLTQQANSQVIYEIIGPFTGSQGGFEVVLNHSVADDFFDCYFDNAGIQIPITGNGFEIRNVSNVDPDDFVIGNENSVVWMRFFGGVMEDLISGTIVQFEVVFVDSGQFTIGQVGPSGRVSNESFFKWRFTLSG